ncbi:MAG: MiaB/RimO family radical SAM methylthiotransferase [Patescibacteria group bacterium]
MKYSTSKKQTWFIKTFGCQMNVADSQRVETALERKGLKKSKTIKEADLVVINSCIVRESAENRVYGLLNKLKGKQVILTGCLAGWLIKNKQKLRGDYKVEIKAIEELAGFDQAQKHQGEIGYIPISNGCNNFCSYCIVPYARGRETYRQQVNILKDVNCAVKKGLGQIMLLGQNVNSYPDFPKLVEEVAKVEGVKLLSFMSANPRNFSDKLIKVIAKRPNISREIHIPIQSGDNQILKAMNRGYTGQNYLSLIRKIKKTIPEAEITTDILIGFPGETESAFQNTIKLCQKIGFKKAYLNKYSPRPGTKASGLPDNIPPKEKKRRWQMLEKLINN